MNELQFYPTTPDITEYIIDFINTDKKSDLEDGKLHILEPSAGEGAILDVLINYFPNQVSKVTAIEIDHSRYSKLLNKGYPTMMLDFLEYKPDEKFDLIIANPPFNKWRKHFIHAYELLGNTGQMIFVLPVTKQKEIEGLLYKYGQKTNDLLEIENIGSVFECYGVHCDIILVSIQRNITETRKYTPINDLHTDVNTPMQSFSTNGLVKADIIDRLIDEFNLVKLHLRKLIESYFIANKSVHFLTNATIDHYLDIKFSQYTANEALTSSIHKLKKEYWGKVIDITNVHELMSSKYKEDFDNKIRNDSNIAFNKQNIMALLDNLYLQRQNIMIDSAEFIFKELTGRHYEKTEWGDRGYKTNKSYKLGRRFIVERGTSQKSKEIDVVEGNKVIKRTRIYYTGLKNWNSTQADAVKDLEKLFAFMEGKKISEVKTVDDGFIENYQNPGSGNTCDSEYFTYRFFQNGNIHFTVKDSAIPLLNDFNYMCVEKRLPGKY